MTRRLTSVLLLLLPACVALADDFSIEPERQTFSVLGFAKGTYGLKGHLGCFKAAEVRLVLHKEQKVPIEIIGFRFGIATPVENNTTYDYLAETEIFPVNRLLERSHPINLSVREMCLSLPPKLATSPQFLSMEIHLKHDNPHGYATTYAHEKNKFLELLPTSAE